MPGAAAAVQDQAIQRGQVVLVAAQMGRMDQQHQTVGLQTPEVVAADQDMLQLFTTVVLVDRALSLFGIQILTLLHQLQQVHQPLQFLMDTVPTLGQETVQSPYEVSYGSLCKIRSKQCSA
jgi:hypothetical protein